MREVAVRVKDVSKVYRRDWDRSKTLKQAILSWCRLRKPKNRTPLCRALEDVSFEVRGGEFFGVIGANGSGKSTLLRILAGIAKPSNGEVERRGRVSPLLDLGAGFHSEFSGRENILMYGCFLGLRRAEIKRRIDVINRFAELEDAIDDPVRSYSSGMHLRLAFSTAIHVDLDILVVDEVLAVGDVRFQRKCLRRIEEIREKGATIILVSHDLGAVKEMCDRVLWLHQGKMMACGEPREVVSQYIKWSQADAANAGLVLPGPKGNLAEKRSPAPFSRK